MASVAQEFGSLFSEEERAEFDTVVSLPAISGYAVFDRSGETIRRTDLSETTVAVFSNIFDLAEQIGAELGEMNTRPAIKITGSDAEAIALPMEKVNLVVLRSKSAGKEAGNVG